MDYITPWLLSTRPYGCVQISWRIGAAKSAARGISKEFADRSDDILRQGSLTQGAKGAGMTEISSETSSRLIKEAMIARQQAYCPYSHYAVGAALLTSDGAVIRGCNVENASYGATICAERNAIFSAVGSGYRKFRALALVSGPEALSGEMLSEQSLPYPSPCGICRQALREFVNPEIFPVILARSIEDYKVMTLDELLPASFGPDYL